MNQKMPCMTFGDSLRPTRYPERPLRPPVRTEISKRHCCAWSAIVYITFGRPLKTRADLVAIQQSLPLPERFTQKDGMLGAFDARYYDLVFRLFGYTLSADVRKSETGEDYLRFLGYYLKCQLLHGASTPGAKFLLRVDVSCSMSHAIAVEITVDGRVRLVDQCTSCFLEQMRDHARFGQWYYTEDFVLRHVLPVSEHPAARASALARCALEADACARRVARDCAANLQRLRAARERGCWSGARGNAYRQWVSLYSKRLYLKLKLAYARREALETLRRAEFAGAVFKRRRRARGMPRLAGSRETGSARALQALALDHARTARALEPRCAAWARAGGDPSFGGPGPGAGRTGTVVSPQVVSPQVVSPQVVSPQVEPARSVQAHDAHDAHETVCFRLNTIELLVSGNTCPDKSTADRVESLERQIGLVVLSGPSIPIRLYRIEDRLRKKTNPRESAGGVLSVRA